MAKRKELKGISAGIAQSFISRNNDIDGYWAMGVIYKEAFINGNKFVLDLFTGKSIPRVKYIKRVADRYQNYLTSQLEKKGLEIFQVIGATLEIEFNISNMPKQIYYNHNFGEPFLVRVLITDDLKKNHIFEQYGWCRKHNPLTEQRSTRQYTM